MYTPAVCVCTSVHASTGLSVEIIRPDFSPSLPLSLSFTKNSEEVKKTCGVGRREREGERERERGMRRLEQEKLDGGKKEWKQLWISWRREEERRKTRRKCDNQDTSCVKTAEMTPWTGARRGSRSSRRDQSGKAVELRAVYFPLLIANVLFLGCEDGRGIKHQDSSGSASLFLALREDMTLSVRAPQQQLNPVRSEQDSLVFPGVGLQQGSDTEPPGNNV
ncbi:uncharacterized protein V6R79_009465 [Siganus canaliculatus]